MSNLCYAPGGCNHTSRDCFSKQASCPYRGATPLPKDEVKHPPHYTKGIECWDFIVSQDLGFLEGNVIKYVTRYRHKNGVQDLYKARQYLERLIQEHGGQSAVGF